jgi:hypothetical protein
MINLFQTMIPKLTYLYLSSVVRGLVRDCRVLPRRGLVLDCHAPLNHRGLIPDRHAQYLLSILVPDRHAQYLLHGLVLDRHASRDPAFACLLSISRHTPFLLAAHPILHILPSSFQRIRRGIG